MTAQVVALADIVAARWRAERQGRSDAPAGVLPRRLAALLGFALADRLAALEAALAEPMAPDLAPLAAAICRIARMAGLDGLAALARGLQRMAVGHDPVAAAALAARLLREGEEALLGLIQPDSPGD